MYEIYFILAVIFILHIFKHLFGHSLSMFLRQNVSCLRKRVKERFDIKVKYTAVS